MNERARHNLIACLAVAVVHFGLDAFYRDVVNANGIAERTDRQFAAMRDEVDVLALGDSHVKWGIDASLPGAFNYALPGESHVQSYYRLRSLLDERGDAIRAVVLSADPHTLARHPDDQFRHYYAGFVDPFELAAVDGGWFERLGEALRGRFAPYVGQRANLVAYLETGRPPEARWLDQVEMQAGALASERRITEYSPEGRRAKARQRIRFHFGPAPAVDATRLHYLEQILRLCEERGVRALFVRFPLSVAYLEALGDARAFDAAIAERVEASPAAELLDARLMFAGDPSVFADVDHLNAEGARRLTRRVAAKLR